MFKDIYRGCFVSAGRLFQSLAPRKEKHFCPFADVFFGSLKSMAKEMATTKAKQVKVRTPHAV